MTSKGLAAAAACALLMGACGGVARPESRSIGSDPIDAESPIASPDGTQTSLVAVPSTTTEAVTSPEPMEPAEPATTSTTSVDESPTSTTTSPAETIDLAEVRDALDALDALFGDLDSQIGSVDLDEGETP